MKTMRKVCVLTANRADFSRLETLVTALQKRNDVELQLIVMGSHLLDKTGKTIDYIQSKGFTPNFTLYMEVAGGNPVTMTKSVGLAMIELASMLDYLKPDVVVAPVDRFESLAMGITPALMNCCVAHIQGGEVTGTIDESIRHALTKMSHLHFVATEGSRERVIRMGEREDCVFNVGCPGTDLLLNSPVLERKQTLEKLNELLKIETKLDLSRSYFLIVQHPVTTEFGNVTHEIIETLEAIKKFKRYQFVVLWPNIDAGSDDISKVLRKFSTEEEKRAFILKHIPSDLFVNIMRNTDCMIGNSSSGIREACYFGTPVVNIGSRQNKRERGKNVKNAGYNRKEIEQAIKEQIAHGRYDAEHLYGDGKSGEKIAEILATIELPDIQKVITY